MKYRTIVADPPWPYPPGSFKLTAATGHGKRRDQPTFAGVGKIIVRELPYQPMSIVEISTLPVSALADPNGCRLFLWTTNAFLPQAFGILESWGFTYNQTLIWHKLNAAPWTTSIARNTAEFILVGRIGNVERIKPLRSAVIEHGAPKDHSRKPELFIDLIEQASPGPYVELFSRRHRLGWDVWGDESANTAEMSA